MGGIGAMAAKANTAVNGIDAQQDSARISKAIGRYARRVGTHNVSECCGKAQSMIYALVREEKLPATFVLSQGFREGVFRMDEEARFASVEQLAISANGRRSPTTYHIVSASAIGERLAVAKQGESVYGKTPEEWVGFVQVLIAEAAKNVEHFYGKTGRGRSGLQAW